jgi:NAD(P)-dependent dehydrogenase (short-subunit alcohol dehydrogenase family)
MNGLHAIITGGGGGLGAASARALSAAGFGITLIGRDEARLQRVADDLPGAVCAPADITNEAEVRAAFEGACDELGPVAVLVNNAGVSPSAPFLRTSRSQWDQTLGVNLTGAYLCTQASLPDMLEAGWGRVINIASTAGKGGTRNQSAYNASKHAVVGLTRCLALEMAPHNVLVNAICPWVVDTDMAQGFMAHHAAINGLDPAEVAARMNANVPLGRWIRPAEVAGLAVYLASDEASYVNGQAWAVDCGYTMI